MGAAKVGPTPAARPPAVHRVDLAWTQPAAVRCERRARLVPSPEPLIAHRTTRHGARAGRMAARLLAVLGMESSKKPRWSVLASIRATFDNRSGRGGAGAGTTSTEVINAREVSFGPKTDLERNWCLLVLVQ